MNDQVSFDFNISPAERRLLSYIILNDNKGAIPLWKFPLRNSKQVTWVLEYPSVTSKHQTTSTATA